MAKAGRSNNSKASPTTSLRRGVPELGRTNSLNMSRQELELVLDSLDHDPSGKGSTKRQAARMAYRETGIELEIFQPGGSTRILVACRNMSRTGLGFLHSSYLHVGTEVIATLPHRTLKQVKVEGTLVRCRHVKRHIHDVGVQFKTPLNLHDFMEIDTLAQAFSCEKVDPKQLKGTLLIVAEYAIEQGCIQSMLSDTPMEFVSASGVDQGVAAARKGCDIILCDDSFENGSGEEFIAKARQNGVRCPIIIMSADRSLQARARLRAAAASGFLEKPLVHDLLLRAIAEFLVVPGEKAADASPLFSTLPANSPLADLADDFVVDLHACANDVEKFVKAGDLAALRKRVLRVAGAAPALGFEPIAKLGHHLVSLLDSSGAIAEAMGPINTFAATCRSALSRMAANAAQQKAAQAAGAEPAANAHHGAGTTAAAPHASPAPHAKAA